MGKIYGATFKFNRIISDDDKGFRVNATSNVSTYTQNSCISHVANKVELSAEMIDLQGKLDFNNIKNTGEMI